MSSIVDFFTSRMKHPAYRGKHFSEDLGALSQKISEAHPTTLGPYSERVSERNSGETAFQRALKKCSKGKLVGVDLEAAIEWLDIELPIIFSKNPRRTSIDLIGRTKPHGTFLCELKYAGPEKQAPPGNRVDYAIFEALLYFEIIGRDHALLEGKVYRPPEISFRWKDVFESRMILVLANDYFWTRARNSQDIERITGLVADIREFLQIDIFLCSTPNYKFKAEGVVGEYEPQLLPRDEKRPATISTFPTYRLK